MKILYVEDTSVYIRMMQRISERLGYTLLIARSASEGLSMVQEQPDLIIVDMQLPDSDGLVLVQKLRITVPNTPIVALTARVLQGEAERCIAAGCTRYVAKPIEMPDLIELLKSYDHNNPGTG